MFMHFRDILDDPLNAFHIQPMPNRREDRIPEQKHPYGHPPLNADNWVEHNQRRARYAVQKLEAAAGRGRTRFMPVYAEYMVELGLYE